MTLRTKISLALLCAATAFQSCQKGHYVPINAELKASYNFKPGSYWIYRDSLSGQIDSFYVTKYDAGTTSTTPRNPNDAYHIESINYDIEQKSMTSYKADTTYYWQVGLSGSDFYLTYYGDASAGSNLYSYDPMFGYPNINATPLSNYSVNGSSYPVVIMAKENGGQTASAYGQSYSYSDSFYLAPKVGFVKLKLSHPEEWLIRLDTNYRNWELVRYKVVM